MSLATDFANTLDTVIRSFNISVGSTVFIFGLIGNILDGIVFISLKTFRRSPCALFLLFLSLSDSGILIFNTLPSIFVNIFKDYDNVNRIFPCKIAVTFAQIFGLMSQIILCFAAFDQYKATSLQENRKIISQKRIRHLMFIGSFVSVLYGIPFLALFDAQLLSGTNSTTCRPNDDYGIFSKFVIYVSLPIIDGFIPLFIMSVFGSMAFGNVRTMHKRKVHIIRLRSEQQLTAMVLVKILCAFITLVPFLIVYVIRFIVSWRTTNLIVQKQFQLVNRVFTLLFFSNYGVS